MLAFAEQFDPQPMHLDPDAAREKGYEVFASVLHAVGIGTRLLVDRRDTDGATVTPQARVVAHTASAPRPSAGSNGRTRNASR